MCEGPTNVILDPGDLDVDWIGRPCLSEAH